MPALVTVPNIEIARVGTWKPNTSDGRPWVVTPADIADAVAASRNGSFRAPIVKLGHADPRFTTGEHELFNRDGTPGVGRLTNLRASEDGQSLLADIEGMPKWLAEAMPSAYPSRSVDALVGAVAGDGQAYRLVITHLALLGESVPAIQSLADVAALYGHDDTDVTQWLAASTVAATLRQENPMPEMVSAARVETVMAAAEAAAKASTVDPDLWCREILRDKVVLVNAKGQVWTATWAENDGNVTIGEPTPVTVAYQPLAASAVAAAAHALHAPVSYARLSPGLGHRKITASLGDTSVSITPAVREALGLDESASEDAVNAALLARLKAPAVVPAPTTQETVPVTPAVVPAAQNDTAPVPNGTAADIDSIVAAKVSAALAPIQASHTAYEAKIAALSGELAERKAKEASDHKAQVISAAANAGKFTPAEREQWEKDYDASPETTERILSRLAPGTAVPVSASGYAGDGERGGDEADRILADMGWTVNG